MSKRSAGLCRLFRRRAIGRLAVQLCLFLLLSNPIALLAWANAQAGDAGDGFALCHAASPTETDAPADHPNESMMPHCPLCLVFNGAVATPPSGAAEIIAAASFHGAPLPPADESLPRGETPRLRPSPRAPPASA